MAYYNQARCCSYTVRAYDPDGETIWMQDYFRGANSGDWTSTADLSLCIIGSVVYVAGPLVTTSAATWNLCRYDLTTGALISRDQIYLLYTSGGGGAEDGSIVDICAGQDGTLGVLFDYGQAIAGHYVGSVDATTLATIWGNVIARTNPLNNNWPISRLEIDADGVGHVGGEGTGRQSMTLDGTTEYITGFDGTFVAWWTDSGFVGKVGLLTGLGNLGTSYNQGGWDLNITEGFAAPASYQMEWNSMLNVAATAVPKSRANDVAVMRASGVATGLVLTGANFYRGTNATAPEGGLGATYGILSTSGAVVDSGNVARVDMSGSFTKAWSTGVGTTLSRVATIEDGGYAVGGSRASLGSIFARDAADAKLWTHSHQNVTDLAATAAGIVVSAGERASISQDVSFL